MNNRNRWGLLAVAAALATYAALYSRVFVDLAHVWRTDENFSHAPLMIPVIGYLIWTRRNELAATPLKPAVSGLVLLVVSLGVLLAGTAGVEFFLMRTSAVGVLVGAVLFLAGWRWLRLLLFPISLTALMIPIPPVIFYQAAFPLQLLATKFGVAALQLLQIPVLREGNVIT